MSQANDQPADAGVDGQGQAPSDDIDTDAFDRMEAPAEVDEDADPDADKGDKDDEPGDDADKAKDPTEDDHVEIERDGQKYRVPKALKDDLLRHEDYTRKTQEVAAQRRTLETERTTWESQREQSRAALPEEHAKVAVINHTITAVKAQFEAPVDASGLKLKDINWIAFRQQVQGNPEAEELYRDLRGRYDTARENLADLETNLKAATEDLTTKEQTRLESQQAATDAELAKAHQDMGSALAAEGWDQKRFDEAAQFVVKDLGYTAEELRTATDPRAWRMADEIRRSRQTITELQAQLKKQNTAANHEKAQASKPAASTGGQGSSTRVRDDVSTDEWMRRRNAKVSAQRR